nr:hypothetical protein ICEMyc226_00311 [Mycolicibacterium sp.]
MVSLPIKRSLIAGAIMLAPQLFGTAAAHAQPPALPFQPGPPGVPLPGGYSYEIGTGNFSFPPRQLDTRGVRTGAVTADPTQTSTGLPNDKPGAAVPNQYFWMNFGNSRYGIQGGIVPPDPTQSVAQSDTGTLPGMVASGGPWPQPLLESPTGTPPKNGVPTGEATNATPPSYPQLEQSGAPPAQPAPPEN